MLNPLYTTNLIYKLRNKIINRHKNPNLNPSRHKHKKLDEEIVDMVIKAILESNMLHMQLILRRCNPHQLALIKINDDDDGIMVLAILLNDPEMVKLICSFGINPN